MLNKIRFRSHAYAYKSQGWGIAEKARRKHSFYLENKFLFTLNLSTCPLSTHSEEVRDDSQHVALTFKQYVASNVFLKSIWMDISFIGSKWINNKNSMMKYRWTSNKCYCQQHEWNQNKADFNIRLCKSPKLWIR